MNRTTRYNLLAVDDEPHNLDSLQRTFRSQYQLFTTTSPAKALKIFKQQDIHLVIADQRMPEMHGTELLQKMREISPFPVRLVLSAYTDQADLIEAINAGEVYRYITKPWEPAELKIIVQQALEFYQATMDRLSLTEELRQANVELAAKNASLQETLEELKTAQEKLIRMERLSVLGKMAGMIIHDLKQPLDIIRSAAETMSRTDLESGDRREVADMIQYEVDRFLEMIQELLDYSRGSFKLQMEPILLSDFWGITETRVHNALGDFPQQIIFSPVTGDATLSIDRHRLQRIFINLIRNSLEAARQTNSTNPLLIQLSAEVGSDSILFTIEDNGPGIPPEQQKDIFLPFVSGNKPFGIGLGLAIVKTIVEEHGGTIELSSTPGSGCKFAIRLKKEN